jgi:hypothetical protein
MMHSVKHLEGTRSFYIWYCPQDLSGISDVQGVSFADLDDSLDLGKHLPYLLIRTGMNYSLILELSN